MEKAFTFVNEVISELEEQMRQEPYQINLLEEVHLHDDGEKGAKKKVGENAHTRILRKILMFKTQTNYPLLVNLIQYVIENSHSTSWDTILSNISDPVFIPEKVCNLSSGRIDLLIEEKGKYAIIFENKINDATDQTNQLGRYIEHLMKSDYREDQIFILYLSAEGKNPDNDSWILGDYNYKENFRPRYFNLSYSKYVLPWLDNCVRDILLKMASQELLKEAVNQYVDYLKGKFSLRTSENIILDKVLEDKLVQDALPLNKQMEILDEKLDKLKKLRDKNKNVTEQETEYNDEMLRKVTHIDNRIRELKKKLLLRCIETKNFKIYNGPQPSGRIVHVGLETFINNCKYLLYIGENSRDFFCSIITLEHTSAIERDFRNLLYSRFFEKEARNKDWLASYYGSLKREERDYEKAVKKMNEVRSFLESEFASELFTKQNEA